MKKWLTILLLIGALAAAGLFWLRGNLDHWVKEAIVHYGSSMTQAEVSVGQVQIRVTDGVGTIRDVRVENPAGFKTPHALKVAEIEVSIDPATLTHDVVVIRKIAILAPDVIYEKGDVSTNFDALQRNIATAVGAGNTSGSGSKRLIVEELTVRDAQAQASAAFMQGKTVAVNLPNITLKNLGKDKGGLTPGELGAEVVQALKHKMAGGFSFDAIGKSASETLDKAGSAIRNMFGK
jgi:hypothetical protein